MSLDFNDSRQTGGGQALLGLPAGARPPADRRRAGVGKTTLAQALARSVSCRFHRLQFTSDMLPSDVLGVTIYNAQTRKPSVQARPGVQQFPAGRRNQPHDPEDAIGAARSHERKPGHHRRPFACAPAAVHGDGHAEPGGAPRHVSAAGEPARPLSDATAHRLPGRRREREIVRGRAELRRQNFGPDCGPRTCCNCRTRLDASPWTTA